jgi:hypothetical protein
VLQFKSCKPASFPAGILPLTLAGSEAETLQSFGLPQQVAKLKANISRKKEHQLPRKGYFKIPRSHCREDALGNEILTK